MSPTRYPGCRTNVRSEAQGESVAEYTPQRDESGRGVRARVGGARANYRGSDSWLNTNTSAPCETRLVRRGCRGPPRALLSACDHDFL
ncbi:hypothetical protein EVAR_38650_1 [Eumeta japonica]|uniref:Uncharacterized protein n=1 Tax=Eumeta variegata TaxID=151549 RepID=A0A4C1XZ30_EUMVA|nr:hypothetical protein EVAR_38650_1 [Eumeta japonica]